MLKKLLTIFAALAAISIGASAGDNISFQIMHPADAQYYVGIPELNVYSDDYTTLDIEIVSDVNSGAKLLWVSSYDTQFSERNSIMFNLSASRTPRHYIINVKSQNQGWVGFIKQIVIMPEAGTTAVRVGSITASHTTLGSLISSGWQEFWGPSSRAILGSTVNNMRTTTVLGKPFNYYLYAAIILSALISFGYFLYKGIPVLAAWQASARITMIASLICWALWQLSFLVTEYSWLKTDLNKYGAFSSLEYKQKAAIGVNFYDFLQFCKKELPERAQTKMVTSDTSNFYNTKAAFYLYPILLNSSEPKYLIVYMYNKGLVQTVSENRGYRLFKKFDEGAFILWK